MTIFDEVKELVDVPTAARCYGVEVHRGNIALCPFHRERNPSCKLYADHYYCFGCQAHGDVIKLVQELFSLSAIEAVKQLNSDFALGLDVDKPPDMEKSTDGAGQSPNGKRRKQGWSICMIRSTSILPCSIGTRYIMLRKLPMMIRTSGMCMLSTISNMRGICLKLSTDTIKSNRKK